VACEELSPKQLSEKAARIEIQLYPPAMFTVNSGFSYCLKSTSKLVLVITSKFFSDNNEEKSKLHLIDGRHFNAQ